MLSASSSGVSRDFPIGDQYCQLQANIYLLEVNNKNTKKRCEMCSKLTIKTPNSGVFIVNSEHISHLFLAFFTIVEFEQINDSTYSVENSFSVEHLCLASGLLRWISRENAINFPQKRFKW